MSSFHLYTLSLIDIDHGAHSSPRVFGWAVFPIRNYSPTLAYNDCAADASLRAYISFPGVVTLRDSTHYVGDIDEDRSFDQ